MVRLSKIYTKTGDSGETGLGDGSRISKASLRVAAIGAVDEANAAIGIARLDAEGDCDAMLARWADRALRAAIGASRVAAMPE